MHILNALGAASVNGLIPSADMTASAYGADLDVTAFDGLGLLVLDVSDPVAGTSPTLDVTLCSGDAASPTTVVYTFDQITATGGVVTLPVDFAKLGQYVRGHAVIGGTDSPEYLVSLTLIAFEKYQ